MTAEDLKARTKAFALRVIKLCEALPRPGAGQVIGRQLLRAGTSVGANYRAACRSRSAAEFIARMGVVEEETDEAAYWIELLIEAKVLPPPRLSLLLRESSELCGIAASSRKTAARRQALQKRSGTAARSPRNRQSEIDNRQSRARANAARPSDGHATP